MNNDRIMEKFEQVVALKTLEKYVKDNFVISTSVNLVGLFILFIASSSIYLSANGFIGNALLALILIPCSFLIGLLMVSWLGILFDEGFFYKTFDELKTKMASKTGVSENLLEHLLDKGNFYENSFVHCLIKVAPNNFREKRYTMEKSLVPNNSERTRQKIERIAKNLASCDRSKNEIRFQCFKKMVKDFNQSIEDENFDDETTYELEKAGVNLNFENKAKMPSKIKIQESI